MAIPELARKLGLGVVDDKLKPQIGKFNGATIKALIGGLAIALPIIEVIMTRLWVFSISQSYWFGSQFPSQPQPTQACTARGVGVDWITPYDWSRTYFVGTLLAIAALLASYRGETKTEAALSRLAAAGAVLVALFPCECDCYHPLHDSVHGIAAGVVYLVLAWFCATFYVKAHDKHHDYALHPDARKNADRRRRVYGICLVGMVASIAIVAFSNHLPQVIRPILLGEGFGLLFFGISWLTASKVLPYVATTNLDREPFF